MFTAIAAAYAAEFLISTAITAYVTAEVYNSVTDGGLYKDQRPTQQTIVDVGGVKIDVYPNDAHPPAHGHVTGPKSKNPEVRIGPNGKPLKGETELTAQQKKIVE